MTLYRDLKNPELHLSVLGSGGSFAGLLFLATLPATVRGHELAIFEIAVAYYLVGAYVAAKIGPVVRRFQFFLTAAICISICAYLVWAGFHFMSAGLAHNARYLVETPAILLGFAGNLPRASTKTLAPSEGGRHLLGSLVVALAVTLVLRRALHQYNFRVTAEIFTALDLLLLFAVLFAHRHRNGWVALALVALAFIPYGVDSRLSRPTPDFVALREDHHGHRLALLESPDPVYPGIPQHQLFLDGELRFDSRKEPSYYHCLTNVALAAADAAENPTRNALVIGGGAGVVARNLLTRTKIKAITVVDDSLVSERARSELKLRIYNLDALKHARVETVAVDPWQWVSRDPNFYDLIVVDWPSGPRMPSERVFSGEFLGRLVKRLNPTGWISMGVGEAFSGKTHYAKTASVLHRTFSALGYQNFVYTNGKNTAGFLIASTDAEFDFKNFAKSFGLTGKKSVGAICHWNPEVAFMSDVLPASVARPRGLFEPYNLEEKFETYGDPALQIEARRAKIPN